MLGATSDQPPHGWERGVPLPFDRNPAGRASFGPGSRSSISPDTGFCDDPGSRSTGTTVGAVGGIRLLECVGTDPAVPQSSRCPELGGNVPSRRGPRRCGPVDGERVACPGPTALTGNDPCIS